MIFSENRYTLFPDHALVSSDLTAPFRQLIWPGATPAVPADKLSGSPRSSACALQLVATLLSKGPYLLPACSAYSMLRSRRSRVSLWRATARMSGARHEGSTRAVAPPYGFRPSG